MSKAAENKKALTKLHSIHSLMLIDFMEIMEGGDRQRLIIFGNATEAELSACWDNIYVRFLELTSKKQMEGYLGRTGRVEDLNAKINRVRLYTVTLVELLGYRFTSQPILNALKEEGYAVNCVSEKRSEFLSLIADAGFDSYADQLSKIDSKLKKEESRLESLKVELEQPKEKKSTYPFEQIIGDGLASIHQVLKVEVNECNMTVYRFCVLIARVREMTKPKGGKHGSG